MKYKNTITEEHIKKIINAETEDDLDTDTLITLYKFIEIRVNITLYSHRSQWRFLETFSITPNTVVDDIYHTLITKCVNNMKIDNNPIGYISTITENAIRYIMYKRRTEITDFEYTHYDDLHMINLINNNESTEKNIIQRIAIKQLISKNQDNKVIIGNEYITTFHKTLLNLFYYKDIHTEVSDTDADLSKLLTPLLEYLKEEEFINIYNVLTTESIEYNIPDKKLLPRILKDNKIYNYIRSSDSKIASLVLSHIKNTCILAIGYVQDSVIIKQLVDELFGFFFIFIKPNKFE
jgi:hypothetical protein